MKRKGSDSWTPIYMLIVLAIAVLILIQVVKPLLRQSQAQAQNNLGNANNAIVSSEFFTPERPYSSSAKSNASILVKLFLNGGS